MLSINVYTSQDVTANLPQLLVDNSCQLLMSEGLSKTNHNIRWNDYSLQKVVKDALLTQICNKLCFCHEDTFSFEGLKKAVLRIDNNYWKQSSKVNIRPHTIHFLHAPPQILQTDQNNSMPPANHTSLSNWAFGERPRPILPQTSTPYMDSSNSFSITKLGPDGHLTLAKHQHYINLDLCIHCGQSGHLARGCSK